MAYALDRRSMLAQTVAFAAAGPVPISGAFGTAAKQDLAAMIEAERASIRTGMAEDQIGATAICLVQQNAPTWIESFGRTSGTDGRAVDAGTLFSIQSTSKHFTAVAVLLAGAGKAA